MEVIKVIFIAIIVSISIVLVKQIKPEFSIFILIGGSIIILGYIMSWFNPVISSIQSIVQKTGLSSSLVENVLKIVGIGYLTEFASNICLDSGNSSIADKVQLAGKTFILIASLPIITELIDIVAGLLIWKRT